MANTIYIIIIQVIQLQYQKVLNCVSRSINPLHSHFTGWQKKTSFIHPHNFFFEKCRFNFNKQKKKINYKNLIK